MRNERKKYREWNINSSMLVWHELGCPKEKLNIGLSAYGSFFFEFSYENFDEVFVCLGRAFSLFGETGGAAAATQKKSKSTIGVKASAAEAGKYTREAGVLAYYEVMIEDFLFNFVFEFSFRFAN